MMLITDKKAIKRAAAIFAAVAILAGAAVLRVINAGQPESAGEFIKDESIRLMVEMDKIAENQEYLKLMTGGSGMMRELEAIGEGDYSHPDTVYFAEKPEELILSYFIGNYDGEQTLSQETVKLLQDRMTTAFMAGTINGTYGAETLAAATLVTVESAYVKPKNWPGNTLVLLTYDNGYAGIVTFVERGEGVITSSASFVKNEDGKIISRLQELFGDMGLEPVAGG